LSLRMDIPSGKKVEFLTVVVVAKALHTTA